jgi:septal ring factor EnvC (AmiA/AmiB activator)
MNNGLLMATGAGAMVSAVAGGTVLHSAPLEGYGTVVIIDHGEGFLSIYAHLSRAMVSSGDKVLMRQSVGLVAPAEDPEAVAALAAAAGKAPATFYFELRQRGVAIDPMPWLQSGDLL